MGAITQGAGASELQWDAQGLVISLSRQVFGAVWERLVACLTKVRQSHGFFVWTQPAMTARGDGPDAPRWKVQPLDVLSGLLFLLKVPTDHELVRLWSVIDWSAINVLCAPPYHNAHGGPHAWAPAQMMALLTLMFLYGVPHETTLLRRVWENIVWCSILVVFSAISSLSTIVFYLLCRQLFHQRLDASPVGREPQQHLITDKDGWRGEAANGLSQLLHVLLAGGHVPLVVLDPLLSEEPLRGLAIGSGGLGVDDDLFRTATKQSVEHRSSLPLASQQPF